MDGIKLAQYITDALVNGRYEYTSTRSILIHVHDDKVPGRFIEVEWKIVE